MDQTARNVSVDFKAQPTLGTPATGAGAKRFRFNGTGGLALTKSKIRSNENRSDGQSTLGRHGPRSVAGSYPADATLGTFDELTEAVVRGTWSAPLVITEATAGLTSVTTVADGIVASAGSWITAGLRKGDVIRPTGLPDAANNSRNLRIVELTALKITTAETLTVNATPDSAFTITRPKKLVNPAVPVRRLFTFEERENDIDASALFPDCRVSSLKVTLSPDGMVLLEFGIVGRDMQVLEGAASPNFTDPTETSTLGLVAVDASIRLGSTTLASLTACEFTMDLGASTMAVLGSPLSQDVYDNNMRPIAGSLSAIRSDMTLLKSFLAEDQLGLHLLLVEPDSEPKDFLSFYLPLLTLDGNTKNFGADGPLIQTVPFEAGKLLSSTNGDLTMVHIQSSAA
jgi:hypothetical protein